MREIKLVLDSLQDREEKSMYIVRAWEGLGNQMFQYAFARAIRHRTGQQVFFRC